MSALLERPLKRAGTRRYTDEFTAGQRFIWDDELDGDLDSLYARANAPVAMDGLADGAVTTPKLADRSATMVKLGVTYGRPRGSVTVPNRLVLPTTFFSVCTLAFTSAAGGLCLRSGSLQFEFDGSNQAAAVAEIQLLLDGVETEVQTTPFTATGAPFVVPLAPLLIIRPAAGPHSIEYRARNAGAVGTTVTVLPSVLGIRELE